MKLLPILSLLGMVADAAGSIIARDRKEQISDLGEAGGNITKIAETLAEDTNHTLWHFPTIKELNNTFGGFRMGPGFYQHMKDIEMAEFGARMVCPNTGRGHIFFLDPFPRDGEMWIYHIYTPWKLLHPGAIARKLKWKGFEVLDWSNGVMCDVWDPLFTITEAGVLRGKVEVNWPENTGAPARPISAWTIQDWQEIVNILEDTYPWLEIVLTVVGSLLGGVLLLFVSLHAYKFACTKYGWKDRTRDYWAWRNKNGPRRRSFEEEMDRARRAHTQGVP